MAEPTTARPLADDSDQTVGDLISQAVRDATRLVRCELDLAKLELRSDAKRLGLAAALVSIAVFTGFLVLVMLCFAMAEGLIALGIWPWAAFLIVAGACVLLAALAIGVVYLKVRRMSGLRRTRESVHDDLALLRRDDEAAVPAAAEAG
ncbi:MAG TPA: phage holin family protein [Streptosporangiaceae bacterium]|nr:phage holin family protein [Streptosporangiaceae bacterium]